MSKWQVAKRTTLALIAAWLLANIFSAPRRVEAISANAERAAHIEAALFTRAEFFGAQALLPYPTAEARARLAAVAQRYPQHSAIQLKLAELEEKLSQPAPAQQSMLRYVELEQNSLTALGKLADFYHRRARFADEAATRERMISAAPKDERAPLLRALIELARRHRLEKYQRPDFFQRLIAADPQAFEVVKQFIDQLVEQQDYDEALRAVRQHRGAFAEQRDHFLEKEVDLLVKLGRDKEAEQVYVAAFDPFWSDAQAQRFYYDFLSERERLRAYGRELKETLRRQPTNFPVAVRLFHYRHYDHDSYGAGATSIFVKLEQARAAQGIPWRTEELALAARLLLARDEAELAARYLYTLYQQGGLPRGSELRAQVLYQLFELLIDAGDERTPLTNGDLKFYQDVATADPHPGMLGGVLSLVLADAQPQQEFVQEEALAVAHFNRAAAYRLFNAYKQEYPTSPQLAQMYLDLIRLYTASGEEQVAAPLLAELAQRFHDAPQFPAVALKLADAYIRRGAYDEERALYRRVLDYLGQRRKAGTSLVPVAQTLEEVTTVKPVIISYPPASNEGVTATGEAGVNNEPDYEHASRFRPVALTAAAKTSADSFPYAAVLHRYVASLARENRTADILALYAGEIKKYPAEQGLYEELLQWLGQTNLVDEQLRVYQAASQRFPTTVWTDRLARWYLRQERRQELERLSQELLQRLDDREIESYFGKFVAAGAQNKATEFERQLYLSLYTQAHQRFPHNLTFVDGLLRYHAAHGQWSEWRQLLAEYYFASRAIREQYLSHLASGGRLREYLDAARGRLSAASAATEQPLLAYQLFRADAAVWLSNYEEAVDAYRALNQLYPNTPEFAERLVAFTRSFGQQEAQPLAEAAALQHALAEAAPSSETYRTTAGELYAELGDYRRAGEQWEQLLKLGAGDEEIYLNTATVYWDYFQYDDALRVLRALRQQQRDQTLYAFQAAAILEAQHKPGAALTEYVKALRQDAPQYWRTKQRLQTLYRRKGVPEQLRAAWETELNRAANRNDDREALVLGYVDLLAEVNHWPEAARLLRREVARSRAQDFLDEARDRFQEHEDDAGELATLRRLTVAAKTFRFAISYQLQLAERHADHGQRDAAAAILSQLINRFPTNYGVLTEAADFYWRIGKREQAIKLLASSAQRSRGRFHYIFARKLAARHGERGQWAAAEATLQKLYDKNPRNFAVFKELTRVYVRTARPDALRERYRQTIRAIKQTDLDRAEIRAQIEELRAQVIEAFTQLKDYPAAIEQHIEIINRDPDDEETVAQAVQYAQRYGGADELIAYYTKTAAQAFKDYRWNLVLARLYAAKRDWTNAARQLRQAIINQPEMIELHSELAEISVQAQNYDAAIAALERVRALSNDDPQYLKRLAEVLEKAGRKREAETVRAQLPVEKPRSQTAGEQFVAAQALARSEREKAIATYRQAFDAFTRDFYKHELRAHELTGYVATVRDAEPLDEILRRLWEVRARIKQDAASKDNLLAGKARSLLETFDRTLPEAVGRVAAEYATGDELAGVERDARQWLAETRNAAEADAVRVVLLNLAQRAGLGVLTEQILQARTDAALALKSAERHTHLTSLVNFHAERGDYRRALAALEQAAAQDQRRAEFGYRQMIAEYARLIGDREKELQALRAEYRARTGDLTTQADALVERYFAALLENGAAGRAELEQCAQQTHPHRFQLISFLVRNNELPLARTAIANAPLPEVWKSARQAELSRLARDFSDEAEADFLRALQWQTIGASLSQQPDLARQLVGDQWFYLAEGYGRWLTAAEKAQRKRATASEIFLPAMVENRPRDANEQWRLGRWYLEQERWPQAVEHLTLAAEMQPDNKQIAADLGSAYFQRGEHAQARAQWERLITGDKLEVEHGALYLRTLTKHGLTGEARARLQQMISRRLTALDRAAARVDDQAEKELEALKPLIRALAASFDRFDQQGDKLPATAEDEIAKAVLLRQFCAAAPRTVSLPEMVVREALVSRSQLAPFYEMLIARTAGVGRADWDDDFRARQQMYPAWSLAEIEAALDHERAASATMQVRASSANQGLSARSEWQQEYLAYLIAERKHDAVARLVAEIERELKGRYSRPDWLRLAKMQLDVRAGRTTQAIAALKHFVGIDASPHLVRIAPPQLERLNQAVVMLRREGQRAAADELLAAAYERTLALEQLQTASFAGLARLAFNKGETARGSKLLQLLTQLGNAETRATAAAELAALDWIKARMVDAAWIEKPAPSNQVAEAEALRLAAETAGEFGQFAAAIQYRQRLAQMTPDDHLNHLELARLLAAGKQEQAAVAVLATLLTERRAPRQARWTAIWSAPEIAGQRVELWRALDEHVRAHGQDREMIAALSTMSSFQRQRKDAAIKLAIEAATTSSSASAKLLPALLLKSAGQDNAALQRFLDARVAVSHTAAMAPFSATEDELRWQLVRLYAAQAQPRAALKLAAVDERLKGKTPAETSAPPPDESDEDATKSAARFLTLSAQAGQRQQRSQLELLALLGSAAEQIGEFGKAADFERAGLAWSMNAAERRKAAARIEQLTARLQAQARQRPLVLTIDQTPVTRQ